jgi:hypothetical protein
MTISPSLISALLIFSCCISPMASGQETHNEGKHVYRHESRWASLPAAEREKMKAAHEKAMNDPSVQKARQNLEQARREFREAVNAAMMKADPSVEQIIEKLKAEKRAMKDED